jgi:hypothetical protein
MTKYDGVFVLSVQPDSDRPFLFHYQGSEVIQLTYIHPKAVSLFEHAHYLELDSSFSTLEPYVYSIPLAIINNNAMPLGIQLSPTESSAHYQTFFTHLEHAMGNPDIITHKIWLSDQGSGIIKFVADNAGTHFFCFRHLLEAIGSNTFAALIAARLLFTTGPEEYKIELIQALEDMNLMIEEREPSFSEKQQKQLCKLFELMKLNNKICPQNSDTPDYFQSLWNRSHYRVTTCSNHSERLHRECNDKTFTSRSMLRNLDNVLKVLDAKFQVVSEEPNRQAKYQFSKLKKLAEKNDAPLETDCPHSWCHWGEIYSARFGVSNFPCYHTARSTDEILFEPLPDLTSFSKSNAPIVIRMATEWQFQDKRNEPNKKVADALNERNSEEPELDDDGKFLYQLCHEILVLGRINENRFTGILIELSVRWGQYCTVNQNNPEKIKKRSLFRYETWKEIGYWKAKYMRP